MLRALDGSSQPFKGGKDQQGGAKWPHTCLGYPGEVKLSKLTSTALFLLSPVTSVGALALQSPC